MFRPRFNIEIKITVEALHDCESPSEIDDELLRLRFAGMEHDMELVDALASGFDVLVHGVEIPKELICLEAGTVHIQEQMQEAELEKEHGKWHRSDI